jgi:anti-sigma regulatory factor (Ser/Thr protein kinase)
VNVVIQEMVVDAGEHMVQFFDEDIELVETVGHYLLAGVRAGDVGLIVATEPHRRAFEAGLARAGVDVDKASREGRLRWLDAETTLATLSPDGHVDHAVFHTVIGGEVQDASSQGCPVRIYGEMVGLLWQAGDVLGAIEVEQLWNALAEQLPFTLFCAYPASQGAGPTQPAALAQICHLHSSVIGQPMTYLTADYEADIHAPGSARRFLTDSLRARGQHVDVVADAASVISELATNAVIHAQTPFTVTVQATNHTVRIEVEDFSTALPTISPLSANAPSARGMALVAGLANRWGVDSAQHGKTVWAELGS